MQYFNPEYPDIIIHEHSSYVDPVTGVQYPRNWDKSTIPGLIQYIPPPAPEPDPAVLAEEEKASRNNNRKSRILELERSQTLRLVREAVLGVEESITKLAAIESDIAEIRTELEK